MWEVPVSSLQTSVTVADGAISGTLKYLGTDNAITSVWGYGNFLALKFASDNWNQYDDVLVGLSPSAGSGMASIKADPDKNGIFKISDKDGQCLRVVRIKDGVEYADVYTLSGLTCQGEGA